MSDNYELMRIWRTKKDGIKDRWGVEGIIHDYEAPLPQYEDKDSVDSAPVTLGDAKEIIRYLLKNDLVGYKLVKKNIKI